MTAIRSFEAQPYWDALQERRLLIQHCADCSTPRHYPRPMCQHCHSFNVEWKASSGKGIVHSWTRTHSTKLPGFSQNTPYTIATIELEEGVRMAAPLRHDEKTPPFIGMPVALVFEQEADSQSLPAFVPAQNP